MHTIHRKPAQVQRDWRLPEGCRFLIWPEYAVEYKGRGYYPSPTEAEVLLLLMSQSYRYFSSREIAEIIYEHREDGGPEWADTGVKTIIHKIRVDGHRAGIEFLLKNPLNEKGYRFFGMRLAEGPLMSLKRLGFIPRGERVIQGVVRKPLGKVLQREPDCAFAD
jgi:hypothetical protein